MLDKQYAADIQAKIDNKTKPLGSLGELESIAFTLALLQSQGKGAAVETIRLNKPAMILFAGDHGIADAGVSIAPSAVTQQMVVNFLNQGAAINSFCQVNDIELKVVDCGILFPVETTSDALISQRLGDRTANFAEQAAMSAKQVEQGIAYGRAIAQRQIESGSDMLMFGEMGIANTSSAAAILAALSGEPASRCVGKGTGISDEQLALKVSLVEKAMPRCQGKDAKTVLAQVGGFEIVQMVGAFLQAREMGIPVLVDGFIVSAAAYAAVNINPDCRDIMLFAHQSQESGHQLVLSLLAARPMLDLGLRLGEGTGAALAYSIVRAAAQFYNQMASFESAGVTV